MENMGAEKQRLFREFEEKGVQEICVSDHINGLQYTTTKSDSFVVDMERFSHIIEKDINANSRITRNLSRKGSFRSGERRANVNEKDTNFTASSPRANSLLGVGSTPEKPMAPLTTSVGISSDHSAPQTHNHQITIVAGHGGATATESKIGGRRFSFRRSSNWTIDPRRILLFFATLSSMGTMLLIYFTLSIGKLNGEDIADLNG